MTFWEWVRVGNAALFLLVFVLFGLVNWRRRHGTDPDDALARFGSWAYFGCAAYATTDAIWNDVPTGPRQGPILACLLLIAYAYSRLAARRRTETR
jgi:hypothetical protein